MNRLLSFVALSAVTAASVVQHPLKDGSSLQTVISKKPLVSSEALEGHITAKGLLKRAEKLYEIAELGAADYNHPTRVIGSTGKQHLQRVPVHYLANDILPQDMLEP
jgi:aminopeptidase Y